ncbi:MAG: hypothetical protein HC905_28175 [Bacteroidales bacterium]|nr:hypothetical protein [Bacteroidales bacterium]
MNFWINGVKHSSEWYDLENNKPYPEKEIRDHVKLFGEILSQYKLDSVYGHSFPESFVPCRYSFYWNPTGDYSLGKVLNDFGIRYANTSFSWIKELSPPIKEGGGIDHGVLVIDRTYLGNKWYELASLPSDNFKKSKNGIIETHFPNWLASDYFLQDELNQKWIDYYRKIQQTREFYFARNTEQFYSQWYYRKYTFIKRNIFL